MSRNYFDCYRCVEKAWERANNTSSWSGKIYESSEYTKLTKEYLNAIIATYLFAKSKVVDGHDVSMERLKNYIIKRVFRKGNTWDIKPDPKEFLERKGLKDKSIEDYVFKLVQKSYPGAMEYVEEIFSVELTEEENRLFEVAKCAADRLEIDELKFKMSENDYEETVKQIERAERKNHVSEFLDEEEMKWFAKLKSANRLIRWQKYLRTIKFTDSAHMFLTALFADLIAQECNELGLVKEKIDPTRAFFTGLFHDIAEVWTGDAPSPCKDEIFFAESDKKLRDIFEEYEDYVYDKYFYKYMDPLLEEEFRKNIVFYEGTDEFSQIIKNADYFSADYEVWLNIKAGNRDMPYFDVIDRSYRKAISENKSLKERTPAATEILRDMYRYSHIELNVPVI